METIIKALKELGIGRHDMATVAATMDGNPSPWEAGKMARKMDGMILDGMQIKVESAGRKVFIFLHNSVLVPGEWISVWDRSCKRRRFFQN